MPARRPVRARSASRRSTPVPPLAVVNAFFGVGPENPALAPMATAEWLPLGVFTTPPHAGSQPTSFQQIAVSKAGQVKGIGHPIKFSNHPVPSESAPPPMLSQHAHEVLAEFNYSSDEIDALIAQGAVASPGAEQN